MSPRRGLVRSAALVAAGALLAACGSSSGEDPGASTSPSAAASDELTVLAAASLKATFTELASTFEDAHPGTTVQLAFGGSSDLVAQLQQGAPGDVLATADTANMEKAAADDLVSGEAAAFATNSMTIAVPPGNPAGIESFADLAEKGARVVVCAPQVPCGAATERVEESTGVTLSPVSEENSVSDVLGKVAAGEADAGVVYVTDIQGSAGSVESVAIPADVNATNTYPIAVLSGSAQPALAGEFVSLVLGDTGQQGLADAGFGEP